MEQCDQPFDVVPLESFDVLFEEGLLPIIERRRLRAPPRAPSVARARWSELLTAATVVSSNSATSETCQRSTSHKISVTR